MMRNRKLYDVAYFLKKDQVFERLGEGKSISMRNDLLCSCVIAAQLRGFSVNSDPFIRILAYIGLY